MPIRFASGAEPRLELGRELRAKAECRRLKGLQRLVEEPEEVLTRPHEAFALLVGARGGGGGGVTRSEFCEVSLEEGKRKYVNRHAFFLVFRKNVLFLCADPVLVKKIKTLPLLDRDSGHREPPTV